MPASGRATAEASGLPELIISGVRVGAHEGYDRVVFDLTGPGQVGYRVAYTQDPAVDGSGAPVKLAGQYVLAVDLLGMAMPGPDSTAYDPGMAVIPGAGLSVVTEVLRTSAFEGEVHNFIGTSQAVPFKVSVLSDPARLVVDVAHS